MVVEMVVLNILLFRFQFDYLKGILQKSWGFRLWGKHPIWELAQYTLVCVVILSQARGTVPRE